MRPAAQRPIAGALKRQRVPCPERLSGPERPPRRSDQMRGPDREASAVRCPQPAGVWPGRVEVPRSGQGLSGARGRLPARCGAPGLVPGRCGAPGLVSGRCGAPDGARALPAVPGVAPAPAAGPTPARALLAVPVLGSGPAAPALVRAPGSAPARAAVPSRAAAGRAGPRTRSGCPPRARRSGGAVLWPSARRSFRPRPGAPLRLHARRHPPRSTRGGDRTCRSRRRSARSPSAQTSRPCPRTAPPRPRRPPPAFPPPPLCRCRGAVRPRMGRTRSGTG
jgi:hypothetical protein